MCDFITLVVSGSNRSAIDVIARRYGRVAASMENPSISLILRDGEFQYLTTKQHCDCGTILANDDPDAPNGIEEKSIMLAKQKSRLIRKGWSQTKINRWLDEKQKSRQRQESGSQDSFELWANLVEEVVSVSDVKRAGLLVHFYSGSFTDEIFEAKRTEVKLSEFKDRLSSMKQDELLIADCA